MSAARADTAYSGTPLPKKLGLVTARGGVGEVEAFLVGHVQLHALGADETGMHVVGAQPPITELDGQDPGGLEESGLAHRIADAVAAHVEWIDVGHS